MGDLELSSIKNYSYHCIKYCIHDMSSCYQNFEIQVCIHTATVLTLTQTNLNHNKFQVGPANERNVHT